MPVVCVNRAEIYYEIMGHGGPWVATISSGRQSLADMASLARSVASCGYRVIAHDRRNCGRSSLDFDTQESEDEVCVNDLHALLKQLDVKRAFMIGLSRGARIAIKFALRHPEQVRGLGLWGLSGGAVAVRYLDDYYYGKYLRACEQGGMEAVCALDHFAALIAAKPSNRDTLLQMDALQFMSTIRRWRTQFLINSDRPVMGLCDEQLRGIGVPTAIVPYYDRMHPHVATAHALSTICGSQLFDFDPTRRYHPAMSSDDLANDTPRVAAVLCGFESSLRRWRTRMSSMCPAFVHRFLLPARSEGWASYGG